MAKGTISPLSKYRKRPNNYQGPLWISTSSGCLNVLPTLPGDNGARDRLKVECHGQHSVQSQSQLSLLVINSKAEPHAALGLGDMQAHTWVSFMGRVEVRLPGATSAHVALIETQSLFYTLARCHFADGHAGSRAGVLQWHLLSRFIGEHQGPWLHLARRVLLKDSEWAAARVAGTSFAVSRLVQQRGLHGKVTSTVYYWVVSDHTLHAEVFSTLMFSKFLSQINFWPPRWWPPLRTHG